MVSDLDIYRSAKLLIDKHGMQALAEADRLCQMSEQRQDGDGISVWERIIVAIKWLQMPENVQMQTAH